jgi:hypothetical protein
MTIRRRCRERSCKDGRRCLEHLRFDAMWRGKRYRIPANEVAIPRMEGVNRTKNKCDASTCGGTICVTRTRVVYWPMASTSESFS